MDLVKNLQLLLVINN